MTIKNATILIVMLVVLAGCATPNVDLVRQAQDNYNRAAQLDNHARVFSSYQIQQQDIVRQASINAMYGSVISTIEGLKPEAVQQVRADGLWGNLLTIKAISEWRLGRYADATESSQQALAFTQNSLPRDQVINDVMPHLIRNDQAKNFIDLHQSGQKFSYQDWLINVQQPLDKVLAVLPVESMKWQDRGRIQVATYLKMNEVIAFINLRDGFVKLNPCAQAQNSVEACKALEENATNNLISEQLLNQYANVLLIANEDKCVAKQDPVLKRMLSKLGLNVPSALNASCQN